MPAGKVCWGMFQSVRGVGLHHLPLLDHLETKFTSLSSQGNEENLPYDPSSSITEQFRASIIGTLENLRPSQGTPLEDVYIDCLILHTLYEKMQDELACAVFTECAPRSVRQLGVLILRLGKSPTG